MNKTRRRKIKNFENAISALKDRLEVASGGLVDGSELESLARHFSESKCSDLRDENEFSRYTNSQQWNITHGDYLVSIVGALSSVENRDGDFFRNGIGLVNTTSKIYEDRADSSYFTKFVLSALAESGIVETGRELVRGAEIARVARGDVPGEIFFPRLNSALTHGAFSNFRELASYEIPFEDYSVLLKTSKNLIVPSQEQAASSKDYRRNSKST